MSDPATLARNLYDAFNRGDFDAALALTQPNVEVVNTAWGVTYHGHDGFREFMQGWKTMDPDGRIEVLRQLPAEDGVANEFVFHAPPSIRQAGRFPPPASR
jgi:hypothetical protein